LPRISHCDTPGRDEFVVARDDFDAPAQTKGRAEASYGGTVKNSHR